eukprot:g31944.t2
MRASVRTLARDDYLAVRLKRLAAWARSCSVAELPAQESGEWNGHGQCRVLARPEVLEPVMRQLELGFQELRGLSEALSGRLLWLEEGTYTARENLRFLTSASLQPLRAQMRTGEIATWSAGAKLPPARGWTASLLFLHPQLRLCERVADHTDGGLQGGAAERARGAGYVATGLLKRGELLVEEGADWLVSSGLAAELGGSASGGGLAPLELTKRYAFRTGRPCDDGAYPAMLFRSCSRFNHSCFPNAGGHLSGGEGVASVSKYRATLSIYALEEIKQGEEALAAVNAKYLSLFDASCEQYDPPRDFESTVERLNSFRKEFAFLDPAHTARRLRRRRSEANETTLASALLQPAAVLVGDTDYAPDAFAARCLLSEGVGFLTRAAALKPEKVPSAKRRRFRKAFAKYQEHIKAAASGVEAEIFQKLAFWLGMMDAWYEQMPVLMDLSLLKDAVAQHVVPLAAWVLRPHLKPIVGRVVPPPDPPDAVLKDEERRGHDVTAD